MISNIIRFIVVVSILFLSSTSLAGIDLPWSSTYDCHEWHHYNEPLKCDKLNKNGRWTASPEDYYEQIVAVANRFSGGGGKGQRHWIGDGTNNNSGGTRIIFNTPQEKFWIRWYMRWQEGFREFGQFKVLYGITPGGSNGPVINFFYPGGGMSFEYLVSGNESCSNCGWGTDFYKSGVSDGSWVYVEAMIDIPDGRLKLWIGPNKRLVIDAFNVTFKESAVESFVVGSNQKNVANGKSMYVDYDDFVITTSGYIGPGSPVKISGNNGLLFLLLK